MHQVLFLHCLNAQEPAHRGRDGLRQQPESAGMWPALFRKHLSLLANGFIPHHEISTYCVLGKVGRLRGHTVGGLPSRHLGREQQEVAVPSGTVRGVS